TRRGQASATDACPAPRASPSSSRLTGIAPHPGRPGSARDRLAPVPGGHSRWSPRLSLRHTKRPPPSRGDGLHLVGDTGIEPVTSSVSRKRAPSAPIAHDAYVRRGGDGI